MERSPGLVAKLAVLPHSSVGKDGPEWLACEVGGHFRTMTSSSLRRQGRDEAWRGKMGVSVKSEIGIDDVNCHQLPGSSLNNALAIPGAICVYLWRIM